MTDVGPLLVKRPPRSAAFRNRGPAPAGQRAAQERQFDPGAPNELGYLGLPAKSSGRICCGTGRSDARRRGIDQNSGKKCALIPQPVFKLRVTNIDAFEKLDVSSPIPVRQRRVHHDAVRIEGNPAKDGSEAGRDAPRRTERISERHWRRLAAPCSGPRSLQSLSCNQARLRRKLREVPTKARRPCAFRHLGVRSVPR